MLINDGRVGDKGETGKSGVVEKVLVRKQRKRLPSMDRLRHELVFQLRDSLRASQEKMNNPDLTLAERHHWTQVHTYTAQVYNTVLKDLQLKDWENRLKYMERRGRRPSDS